MLAATPAAAATPADRRRVAAPAPKVRRCSAAPRAWALTAGHTGSRVRVKGQGKSLKRVDSVVFQGAPGGADDVSVAPLRAKKNYVDARVPRTAVTGPVHARLHRRRRVRPHRRPADHRPDAGRRRRRRPTASGSTSRCRATASSTAPSARRRSPTSCATTSRSRSRSSSSGSPTASRSRAGSRARSRPTCRRRSTWDGTADGKVQKRRPLRLPRLRHLRRQAPPPPPPRPPRPGTPAKPRPGSFLFQRNIFPIRGSHYVRHRSRGVRRRPRPPGPGRLRQVRHPAGRRPRRAREVQAVPLGGRQLPRHRRRPHGLRLRLHAHARGRRSSTRATTSTPASRSASSATPAAPTAATSTSRSGRRRAGTAAGSPIDPLPMLSAWDKAS